MEKWMKNGTFGEKRWKNGRKNGRKTALFFTKIQSPVSGVEKWGEIEVSGGLRKIGDFIGLLLASMALYVRQSGVAGAQVTKVVVETILQAPCHM